MKICLINPPSPFLTDERVFVSLGMLRVAASLEKSRHLVSVLDLSTHNDDWKEVMVQVMCGVGIVGISATSPQMKYIPEIAGHLRSHYSKKIILGGPHATMVNAAAKKGLSRAIAEMDRLKAMFDVVVCGDGELAVHKAIHFDSQGLIDSEEDTLLFMDDETYDRMPFPARHLVDMKSYHYEIDGKNTTNLIGQLGCPFNCSFCGGRNSRTFRKVRNRSIGSIMEEIELLHTKYGYEGFMFYDDELNISNKKFIKLMENLKSYQVNKNVEFKLRGFIKSELFTLEQARMMKDTGFSWVLCGFESGSPRMLQNMNKTNTIDDNDRVVEISREVGLKIKALMSIGHPGECRDTVENTLKWIKKTRPNEVDYTIISVFPGTTYYDDSIWNKDKCAWQYTHPVTSDKLYSMNIDYSRDSNFYKSKSGEYRSFVFTDHLSTDDIVGMQKYLEEKTRNLT